MSKRKLFFVILLGGIVGGIGVSVRFGFPRHENKDRVVLFCLDGAAWHFLKPLIARGELPNFKKLVTEGVAGPLFSEEAFSPPCWTSIGTGKDSSKHHVHDFLDGPRRHARYVWDILSDKGIRIGEFNWLMSSCEKINGVSYNCNPILKKTCTYPSLTFSPLLLAKFMEESWKVRIPAWETVEVYKFLEPGDQFSEDLNKFLIQHYGLEFVAVGYFGTDAFQHRYWSAFEPHYFDITRDEVSKKKDMIVSYYKKIDRILKFYIDNDFIIIFVSDHGFRRNDKSAGPRLIKYLHLNSNRQHVNFLVNVFLEKTGFLTLLPEKENGGQIDFARSRAYFYNDADQGIFGIRINRESVAGEDIVTLRQKISALLKNTHFEDQTPVFQDVQEHGIKNSSLGADVTFKMSPILKKENIFYREPNLPQEANRFYHITLLAVKNNGRDLHKIVAAGKEFTLDDLISYSHDGVHHQEGVVIMRGPHVRKNCWINGAKLTDIVPTILYLLKLPVARDMDGAVLTQALDPEFVAANPVKFVATYEKSSSTASPQQRTSDRTEIDLERLRSLGYAQ